MRHDVPAWDVIAFGNSFPLPRGATFLPVPGGVLQFQPAGTAPAWHDTLASRLATRIPWLPEVELPRNVSDPCTQADASLANQHAQLLQAWLTGRPLRRFWWCLRGEAVIACVFMASSAERS